jgi:hypothetical protein
MDLTTILEYAENHGLAIVLLIVLIIGIQKFIDWALPVLQRIIYKALDIDLDRNYKQWFADNLIQRSQGEQLLQQLLDELDCDRISLFEYHNGGRAVSGLDYQKVSNSLEVTRRGQRRLMQELQNLPVGFFSRWNTLVVRHEMATRDNVEEILNMDETQYGFLTSRGTKSAYMIGLYDISDLPFGFLLIEYCTKKCRITNKLLERIDVVANRLGILLNAVPLTAKKRHG